MFIITALSINGCLNTERQEKQVSPLSEIQKEALSMTVQQIIMALPSSFTKYLILALINRVYRENYLNIVWETFLVLCSFYKLHKTN